MLLLLNSKRFFFQSEAATALSLIQTFQAVRVRLFQSLSVTRLIQKLLFADQSCFGLWPTLFA